MAAAIALIALLAPGAVRAQYPAQPAQPQQPARPASPQAPITTPEPSRSNAIVRPAPTPDEMTKMPAVLHLPGEDAAVVRRDLVYGAAAGQPLRFDLYLPPGATTAPRAAIVFVSGASDTRSWSVYESYGRLAAAQGFAGLVYAKRYERGQALEGVADTGRLLDHLREHGRELGIDPSRIVLWGFSGG